MSSRRCIDVRSRLKSTMTTITAMHLLFGLLLIARIQDQVQAANILALMAAPYQSHRMHVRPLMIALASRGHQVTVLSGYPEKKPIPNHRDIVIEGMQDAVTKHIDAQSIATGNPVHNILIPFNSIINLAHGMESVLELSLASNGTRTLMKSNEKFDLIFADISSDECYLAFLHKFNYPPLIGIVPYGTNEWGNWMVGNPDTPSYIPNNFLPFNSEMTFYERVINTMTYMGVHIYNRFSHHARMNRMIRKHFGGYVPSVDELGKHLSLLMVETDNILDYPRPLVPATIQIGGMHLKPSKPLPEDIQRFIDESPNGVVYFSFGTVVRSDTISGAKLKAIIDAFRGLPQRVLWKWQSDTLPDLPSNVMVRNWLPQNDILGHPNVRLFVTHGGLTSLEEAVYHSVPMVAIPFFADQPFQAKKIETRGIGVELDFLTLTRVSFLDAMQRVINNSSFKTNAVLLSRLYKDEPTTSLERAIFWTEYVLRHNGASHLRVSSIDLSFIQYYLLDVLFVMLVIVCVVIFSVIAFLRAAFRFVTSRRWYRKYNLLKMVKRAHGLITSKASKMLMRHAYLHYKAIVKSYVLRDDKHKV